MRGLPDTHVLGFAEDVDEPARQRHASAVIKQHRAAGEAVLCAQVLQEYVNVALRKLGLPAPLIRGRLTFDRRFEVAIATPDLIAGALDLQVLHGLSLHDAMIVQAAQASGCQRVLSEDMHHGARYGGVQIVNPFLD